LPHGKNEARAHEKTEIFPGAFLGAVAQKIVQAKRFLVLNDVPEKKPKGVLFEAAIKVLSGSFSRRDEKAPLLFSRITAKAAPDERP